MPPEDKTLIETSDRGSDTGESENVDVVLVRDAKDVPDEFIEKEDQHNELRKAGVTPSSQGLPRVDLDYNSDGSVMATIRDKQMRVNGASEKDALEQQRQDLLQQLEQSEARDSGPKTGSKTLVNPTNPKLAAEQIQKLLSDSKSPGLDVRHALKEMTPEYANKVREELKAKHNVDLYQVAPELERRDKALDAVKANPDINEDRERLEKLAAQKIHNPKERKEFLENMQKFEGNMAFQQAEYQKEFLAKGMTQEAAEQEAATKCHEQVEKSYENMQRLLESNKSATIPEADRVTLAKQTMEHMADTRSISQGNHSTCNTAAIETKTFAKDPAEATRMIADVATTGKYTTKTGLTVDYSQDKESLQKHGQSQEVPPRARVDGHRDYASQIFQVTAFNVALERQNQRAEPHGHKRFVQHKETPGRNPPPDDNGDKLIDDSLKDPKTGKPPILNDDPGMSSADIADAIKDISPSAEGRVLVEEAGSNVVNLRKQLVEIELRQADVKVTDAQGNVLDKDHPDYCKQAHAAIDAKEGLDDTKRKSLHAEVTKLENAIKSAEGIATIHSADEMKEALAKAKREGRLPVVLSVDTNNEPFWTDSGGGTAGGSGGGHVVTITDYDEASGMARMQNQWGRDTSHAVSAEELYRATRSPKDNLADLQKQVDDARKSGQPDFQKEYELLGFQRRLKIISDADFDQKFIDLTFERYKRAKEANELSSPTFQETSKQAAKIIEEIKQIKGGPARADKITKEVRRRMNELNKP